MLSKQELKQVFYSTITTKTLFWVRYRTYLIAFLAGLKHLFKKEKPLPAVTKPSILFFSTEAFIDIKQLDDFELLIYKEKVSKGTKINFKREETLMALAFLMPYPVQKYVYERVYKSIARKLGQYDIKFFLCNNPELLNYPIAQYLKTRGIPSGTIQHGVYMPDYYKPNYYETHMAEYVFVWGKVYKDCFKKGGVPEDRLEIVCPPFYFEIQDKDFSREKPVFLGQQLYKVSNVVNKPYNEMVQKLADHYNNKGLRLQYKPHPREDVNKSLTAQVLGQIDILPKTSVTHNFYNDYTHAFSVSSTALFKALCSGLACYQPDLRIDFPYMHFAQYARIPTLYIETVDEELSKPFEPVTEQDISREYLFLKPNPTFENAMILKSCILKSYLPVNV